WQPRQWHLKWSKGSRHALHRHNALHEVEPNSTRRDVSVELHLTQATASMPKRARRPSPCSGGAIPNALSLTLASSVIQSVVQAGDRTVLTLTCRKPAWRSA